MRGFLIIVISALIFCSSVFAEVYSTYDYKQFYIKENDKKNPVYNILVNDWNNFLIAIEKDNSCDSIPVSLTVYTELMTCYYREYEKHMRRNDINVSQEIIDAFYDHYSDLFSRANSLQIKWLQTTQRGGRPDVKREVETWVIHHNASFMETLKYSKNEWMKYAELRSSNYKKETEQKNKVKSGSGFYINNQGYFVTNYHVVEGCSQSKITFNKKDTNAKLIATDKSLDLALLKVDTRPKNYLSISSTPPKKLQKIFVAGYPFGKGLSDDLKFTQGIISSVKGFDDNSNQIQLDAAINPGNSGGPIVGEEGDLVAVAVSGLSKSKSEGIGFGIKASSLKSFLDVNDVKYSSSGGLFNFSSNSNKLNKILEESTVYTFCK